MDLETLKREYDKGNWKTVRNPLLQLMPKLAETLPAAEFAEWIQRYVTCCKKLSAWKDWIREARGLLRLCEGKWETLETLAKGYGTYYQDWFSAEEDAHQMAKALYGEAFQVARSEASFPAPAHAPLLKTLASQLNTGLARMKGRFTLWKRPKAGECKTLEEAWEPEEDEDEVSKATFFAIPASWETAVDDGERWEWLMAQLAAIGPEEEAWALRERAKTYGNALLPEVRGDLDCPVELLRGLHADEILVKGEGGTWGKRTVPAEYAPLLLYLRAFSMMALQKPRLDFQEILAALHARAVSGERLSYEEMQTKVIAAIGNIFEGRLQLETAAEWYQALLDAGDVVCEDAPLDKWLATVAAPQLSFTTFHEVACGNLCRLQFQFRNLSTLKLTIVRLDPRKLWQNNLNFWGMLKMYAEFFPHERAFLTRYADCLAGDPVQCDFSLPAESYPHALMSWSVELPIQEPGFYLVKTAVAEGFSCMVLGLPGMRFVEFDGRFQLLETTGGRPVEKCEVHFVPEKSPKKKQSRSTDDQGFLPALQFSANKEYHIYAMDERYGIAYTEQSIFSHRHTSRQEEMRGVIRFDRPVYRPGDTMRMHAFCALIRRDGTLRDNPVRGKKAVIELESPYPHSETTTHEVRLDAFGGAAFEWILPAECKLGQWRVQLRVAVEGGNELWLACIDHFQVEEYRKPEYEVILQLPEEKASPGEKVEVTGLARTFFGAPVNQGTVKLEIALEKLEFWGWWFDRERRERPLVEREFPLDAEGRFRYTVTMPAKSTGNYNCRVQAEVHDAAGRVVATEGEFPLVAAYAELELSTPREYCLEGTPVTWWLRRHFLQQEIPLLRETLSFTPRPFRQIDDREERETEDEEEPCDEVVPPTVVVEVTGRDECTLALEQAGAYAVEYTAEFSDGRRECAKTAWITVLPPDEQASVPSVEGLALLQEQSSYTAPCAARLAVVAAHANAWVTLAIQREDDPQPEFRVIQLNGHYALVEIPMAPTDRPGFWVSAWSLWEAEMHRQARWLDIPPPSRELQVTATLDRDSCEPGGTVSCAMQVKAPDGTPAQATLAIAVFDRALEALSEASLSGFAHEIWHFCRDCISVFWDCQYWPSYYNTAGVRGPGTYGSRSHDRYDCCLGCDNAPEEGPQRLPPTLRSDFRDTALWIGRLDTDEAGCARCEIPLPDSLTSWRVAVWAFTRQALAGEAHTELTTVLPLSSRLETPRFFIEGDDGCIYALVDNITDAPLRVSATLEADGRLALASDSVCETMVAAHGEARLTWAVTAREPGEAALTLRVQREGGFADALTRTLPVLDRGFLRRRSLHGVLEPEQPEMRMSFEVPAEIRPGSAKVTGKVTASPLAAAVAALPYLLRYRLDCAEQLAHRAIPGFAVRRWLAARGLKLGDFLAVQTQGELDEGAIERRITGCLKELKRRQFLHGGWNWFGGEGGPARPDPFITAQVAEALSWACPSEGQVPDLARALDWLSRWLAGRQEKEVYSLDALVFRVLAEAGAYSPQVADRLFAVKKELLVAAKVDLALGLHAGKDERWHEACENVAQYLTVNQGDCTAHLRVEGDFWFRWFGDGFTANANYLRLLLRTEGNSRLAGQVVNYLLAIRYEGTRWRSTIDTAAVVRALLEYTEADGGGASATCTATLDGAPVITPTGPLTWQEELGEGGTITAPVAAAGRHVLALRRPEAMRVHFAGCIEYYDLDAEHAPATGTTLQLNRNCKRIGEKLDGVQPVRVGEVIEVRLTVSASHDCEYLMLVDHKPAGFEATECHSGYDWRSGAYVEYRDSEVRFFLAWLPRGTTHFTYRLRAETPGQYLARPATIAGMYQPELCANTRAATWRLQE